ncbi:MAG: hypothetical protein COA90_00350 [Gammaproteobacteria bacterium]|nr:MAG: hypothetical protein COA90_00350 [Gammaproteobacteria bacterium]
MSDKNQRQVLEILENKAVAKHISAQIAKIAKKNELSNLLIWQQPLGQTSSDFVFSAPRPSGGVNVMLADFMTQGLSAAVSALSVAEIFYSMTEKGFGLSDIIAEINKKLLYILPESLCCEACFIELDQESRILAVWNGAKTDLIVIDAVSIIKNRVHSQHESLGMREFTKSDLETLFIEVAEGDRIYLYSDGLSSSMAQQEIEASIKADTSLSTLKRDLALLNKDDDLTLISLEIKSTQTELVPELVSTSSLSLIPPTKWQVDFNFSAKTLKHLDLVPLLINILAQVQALNGHKQRIYTVLAEMYSNALEHGLLEMESNIKDGANGFAEYYALRAKRLAELESGYIKVSLQHDVVETGGRLIVIFEDSGAGFDHQRYALDSNDEQLLLCGRGGQLLRQLCSHFVYNDRGNKVEAHYQWTR